MQIGKYKTRERLSLFKGERERKKNYNKINVFSLVVRKVRPGEEKTKTTHNSERSIHIKLSFLIFQNIFTHIVPRPTSNVHAGDRVEAKYTQKAINNGAK